MFIQQFIGPIQYVWNEPDKITPAVWSRDGSKILVVVVVKTVSPAIDNSRASLNIKLVFPPPPTRLTTPPPFSISPSLSETIDSFLLFQNEIKL